ncbi:Late embryogenesis abundant protein, LEA-14 [Gossypium australe]|uniref:Late embryogenesis abundant protein, LEA-14 n=1 Tax=Gossypium australe TaxID=47621 RepID=A0A5B6UZD0_9ROSI|nr:Late embryogenesis abundant protein, LEA-14 [Gossypium australe]
MDQMNRRRRQLTPYQRSVKNERDRRRRREKNMENKRLRNAEMELQASVAEQRNEITSLRRNNEMLNDSVANLQNTISQQREQIRELHQKKLELEEIVKQAESFFKFDDFPGPNEEAPNNETA